MEYRDRRPTSDIALALRMAVKEQRPCDTPTLHKLEVEFRRGLKAQQVTQGQRTDRLYVEPYK